MNNKQPTAFLDEEMDCRTMRNLQAYHNDQSTMVLGEKITPVNASKVDALLDTIDCEPEDNVNLDSDVEIKLPPISAALLNIVRAGLKKSEEDYAANRESYLQARRAAARRDYANERATEGKGVRSYQRRPKVSNETPWDREIRLHREDSRRRSGKDNNTVRGYTRLDELTEEEKNLRKREQDAASKRSRRAALKSKAGPVSGEGR